jgi:hypothetical protein
MYYEMLAIAQTGELVSICETYSSQFPGIWREAIRLAIAAKDVETTRQLVSIVLDRDLLSFNSIMPLLAKTSFCDYSMVQSFAIRALGKLSAEVRAREQTLEQADAELERNNATIEQLGHDYFAIKPGLCCGCSVRLDAPARHFRCGHSFHVRCLGSAPKTCPTCRDVHMQSAQAKREAIIAARGMEDVERELANAEDPLGELTKLMGGAHFMPGVDQGGEEGCDRVIAIVTAESDVADDE